MKLFAIFALLFTSYLVQAAAVRIIEIDVHGMTCAFCVDSLERKFAKLDSVINIQVSMKMKKVRLETGPNQPSIETIKQTIVDAGFTPVNITVMADEKVQN